MAMSRYTKNKQLTRSNDKKEGRYSREMAVSSIRSKEGEGNESKFIISFSSEENYDLWWGT